MTFFVCVVRSSAAIEDAPAVAALSVSAVVSMESTSGASGVCCSASAAGAVSSDLQVVAPTAVAPPVSSVSSI